MRSEAVQEVGPFDEQFFLYFEEIDWCKRAREAGWRIRLVPEVAALHAVGRSASTVPALATWARYQSMVRYFRKHHGVWAAAAIRTLGAAVSTARVVARPRDSLEPRAALRAFLGRERPWT
jgi:GT2 family glycosyltransferase